MKEWYVYILTNLSRTVLYIGVTNNLDNRLQQHAAQQGNGRTFAGRYHCHKLLYYETYNHPNNAILREKQLKRWSRAKKEQLINSLNPKWEFVDDRLLQGLEPFDKD